jgi:hypothetical protein
MLLRNFSSILKFCIPHVSGRSLIWQKSFPEDSTLSDKPENNAGEADNVYVAN